MKRFLVCAGLLVTATALLAQHGPPKSPAATETATVAGKSITITYSSPRVRGREGHLFTQGGLISHDPNYPVWRAGANAATTLETTGDLTIGSVKVPKGKYTLYVNIASPDAWVLIINKQTGQWGLKYDKAQDLGQVRMTMTKPASLVENLKYTLKATGGNRGTLSLAWENHIGTVRFTVH